MQRCIAGICTAGLIHAVPIIGICTDMHIPDEMAGSLQLASWDRMVTDYSKGKGSLAKDMFF